MFDSALSFVRPIGDSSPYQGGSNAPGTYNPQYDRAYQLESANRARDNTFQAQSDYRRADFDAQGEVRRTTLQMASNAQDQAAQFKLNAYNQTAETSRLQYSTTASQASQAYGANQDFYGQVQQGALQNNQRRVLRMSPNG